MAHVAPGRFGESFPSKVTPLRHAARRYGLDLPSDLETAYDRHLAVEALVRENAGTGTYDLAERVVMAPDMVAALDGLAADYLVRQAVAKAGDDLRRVAKDRLGEALRTGYRDLVAALKPRLDDDLATIAQLAPALPSGEDALTDSAVLRHEGAAKAWAEIDEPLTRVLTVASSFPTPVADVSGALPPNVGTLLYLVRPPTIDGPLTLGTFEDFHLLDQYAAENMPRQIRERRRIEAFRDLVTKHGERLALVMVAQGEAKGFRLEAVADVDDDLMTRAQHFADGMTRIVKSTAMGETPVG